MKKILLLFAFVTFTVVMFSQENPCPTVGGIRKTNIVNNGNGTCTATLTLHITNDVSNANPKPVKVEVICSVTGGVTITQCFIASTVPGGADYTTNPFTCLCNAPVTIRITRYTASNGLCQGGTCGNTIIIQESPLPVTFTSFTAVRNTASNVLVKWETASEQNNTGFAVERNINGTWQQVAFVPTQAVGGNSDIKLSYSYSDINSTKSISQYRIKQIDIDSKSKYTEVRSVRGDGQPGKTIVYPNPSNDGKVNIVFEEATGTRNISVMDMSGRIVKQIKGVTNNNVQIEKLLPGMYSIRVMIVETGEQAVEKFVVNK
jgi:Secretion system C-terminal sorting domain